MSDAQVTIKGWSIKCSCHTYITLYYDGKFVHCFDNDLHFDNPLKDEYYTEHIIATIEKRTHLKVTDIPIIGHIEDFDGMRFLHNRFTRGSEWLNKNQEYGFMKDGEKS